MTRNDTSSTIEALAASSSEHALSDDRLADLQHTIEHAAHLLPSQGPIKVFVHHNTLHAFEHLSFDQGVRAGFNTFGSEPYLSEEAYRACLISGRIRHQELMSILSEDLGDSGDVLLGLLGTRFRLRMSMLEYPLQLAPNRELRWLVAESDALRKFRPFVHGPRKLQMVAETHRWVMRDLRSPNSCHKGGAGHGQDVLIRQHVHELFELFGKSTIERWNDDTWESFCLHLLWRICLDGVQRASSEMPDVDSPSVRHAQLLRQVTHEDCDLLVNDLLIRFCAAFLDQGYAHWTLPNRDQGFWQAFHSMYANSLPVPDLWLRGLRQELLRIQAAKLSPLESIEESLALLGVTEEEHATFLVATLQTLPGWAGMIWQTETNAEWTAFRAPHGTLIAYVAVRLILDRLALSYSARQSLGWTGNLADVRTMLKARLPGGESGNFEQQAFLVFQLAQVHGWSPQELHALPIPQWKMLLRELHNFDSIERRRILHGAYERRYRNHALDALSIHARQRQPWAHESSPKRSTARQYAVDAMTLRGPFPGGTNLGTVPSFQIVCCIDEREESFRRHLEEIDPLCETFGAAGFFGVAMYYRGASEAHARPLCPVVVKPKHYVCEEVPEQLVKEHNRRAETRRVLGSASHKVHLGSRTFIGGLVTALTGTLASIPMVMRILYPRATAQIRSLFGRFLRPPAVTRLTIERTTTEPGPNDGERGFSVDEMVAIVERQLRDIGLTSHFAPLVVMCGHGSSSLNNPHESAYNCGACSGGRGGPNARAFAEMANDPRVRERLAARELRIPAETTFLGAFHNTCDDSVTFFALDRLPPHQHERFSSMKDVIDEARYRNAHERCRRFESAPLSLSFDQALRHVEGRSEDLSQARPEYNHATNAMCLVGQRWWSRSLYMDRRAFLQSYDPSQDDAESSILLRILSAVIPVCAGISLEYYFSCVDPAILGCGSKLPHNITSLLGVMEGAASDLRPGLSQQMIEIHEPMRLLFVIQTSPQAMLSIMERNPIIARLCRNEWVQLAVFDPATSKLQVLREGIFHPYVVHGDTLPQTETSVDWYRGWRDHLGFAEIHEPQTRV